MSKDKRKKRSEGGGENATQRAGESSGKRGLWALGVVAAVATCGAVAGLLTLRPPSEQDTPDTASTPAARPAPSDDKHETQAESTGPDDSSDPSEWRIPLFDTTNMQMAVSDRLMRTRAAVMRYPDSSEAWGQLGAVCDAHNLSDCAEICYRRAHALEPEDFRFVYLLAVVLDSEGRPPEEFVSLYRDAIRLAPDYPQVYHRIGDALAEQGKLAEARESYLKAVELDPDFAAAHRSLGQTALTMGDAKAAVEHLQRALELTPDDGVIHATLARAYTALGDRERGEKAAEKSRTLKHRYDIPDPLVEEVHAMAISSPVCYTRAKRLIHEGNHAAAIPDLKIVEKARPKDPLVQVFLGSAYRHSGDLDQAEKHLSKALELNPDSVSALMESGMVMEQRGQAADAVSFYRRALAHKPEHPDINTRLGFALVKTHEFEEAVAAFERASAAATLGANEQLNWGVALHEIGRIEESVTHLRESVRLAPMYADGHYYLGRALEQLGRADEARAEYERAVEINPQHPAARKLNGG